MAFASIHWYGAMVDTPIIEANSPEIIRQLRDSKALPLLDFPLEKVYPRLVEQFYQNVKPVEEDPYILKGKLEGVEITLDAASLASAFRGLSTEGIKVLPANLLSLGWPSLRPNEGPSPVLKSSENRKRDYPLVPQFHAELIDRVLLCKYG